MVSKIADIDIIGSEIMASFNKATEEAKERALDAAAKLVKDEIEKVAPVNTGEYKKSFIIKKTRNGRRISNTKKVTSKKSNKQVPLSNILEFNGHAHMEPTFNRLQGQIIEIFKRELNI